jgi:hypothetical protein
MLQINDDTEIHVDEIVVGVSEECRSLVSPGPLGCRIGWRDDRHNIAGRAPRGIVEGRQILLHRAAELLGIAIPAPILTRDRTLLIGVRLNQTRIDRKAITANQTGRVARFDDPLEHAVESVSLAVRLAAAAEYQFNIVTAAPQPEPRQPSADDLGKRLQTARLA